MQNVSVAVSEPSLTHLHRLFREVQEQREFFAPDMIKNIDSWCFKLLNKAQLRQKNWATTTWYFQRGRSTLLECDTVQNNGHSTMLQPCKLVQRIVARPIIPILLFMLTIVPLSIPWRASNTIISTSSSWLEPYHCLHRHQAG